MELDEKVLDKLDKLLKPNQKLRIDYGANNFNNKTIYIRAVVDEYQVVYKTWYKHKKRWSYQIEDIYYFYFLLKGGNLKKA
jgi:hypothetical protein